MPRDPALIREWLQKARNDLETARRAMAEKPILDTGCFHCQQAVEKLLKGVLAWHEVVTPKVHALGLLFDMAEQVDSSLAELRDSCEWLTRFAIDTRYPHGRDPTPEKALQALAAAEAAYQFVLKRLPTDTHPHQTANPDAR
ncbi:MAG: hypothetical protein CHACPFDD_03412 [Phycisphaerae bacterium]|nr:hypothetical protein [Phycisphaerae bacterium]